MMFTIIFLCLFSSISTFSAGCFLAILALLLAILFPAVLNGLVVTEIGHDFFASEVSGSPTVQPEIALPGLRK
jgi:hypothetical protein